MIDFSIYEKKPRWDDFLMPCPLVDRDFERWVDHFKRKKIPTKIVNVTYNRRKMRTLQVYRRWYISNWQNRKRKSG